jgi:hypothetical protein
MLDQRLHRWVIAIELAQLDRKTLAQVSGADARGIEFLQHGENRLDGLLRRAKPLGGLSQIQRQVASLIDKVDKVLPDHALRRVGESYRQLFGEMTAERDLGRDKGLQIVALVVGSAAAPFGVRGRRRVLRIPRGSLGGLL